MTRIDSYRQCADAGMTKAETARLYNVSAQAITDAAEKHGIELRSRQKNKKRAANDEIVRRLRDYLDEPSDVRVKAFSASPDAIRRALARREPQQ